MKAISTVIATVLMLMIVIALGGTTYLYISGIFTGKTAAAFEIIDAINDTVIIRNSGTEQITSFSSAIVDGNPAVYRVSAQDSSLVGYWKMDEASWVNDCSTPTVIDLAGSNYGKSCPAGAGPIGGGVGKFGNSGDFDGVNDYVDTVNKVLFTTEFTIGTWFNSNEWAAWPSDYAMDTLVSKWDCVNGNCGAGRVDEGYIFGRFFGGTNFGISISNGADGVNAKQAYVATSTISTGTWHHVVATFKGSTFLRLYIDGVLVNENTANMYAFVDDAENRNINIGRFSHGYGLFNGLIDEVRIYNRELSESEVKAEYNIGKIINPGEIATIKIYNTISKGTHTLRLCTSSMCNTAILSIL